MASGSRSQDDRDQNAGKYVDEEGKTKEAVVRLGALEAVLSPKLNLLSLSSFRQGFIEDERGKRIDYEFDGLFMFQNPIPMRVGDFLKEVEESLKFKMNAPEDSSVQSYIWKTQTPNAQKIQKSDLIIFEVTTHLTQNNFVKLKKKPEKIARLYENLEAQFHPKNAFIIIMQNGTQAEFKSASSFRDAIPFQKKSKLSKNERFFDYCGTVYFNADQLWEGTMGTIPNKKNKVVEAYLNLETKFELSASRIKNLERKNAQIPKLKRRIIELEKKFSALAKAFQKVKRPSSKIHQGTKKIVKKREQGR